MLKKLLDKLCCKHDWEELKHINVYDDVKYSNLPAYHIYLFKCNKCGKLKKVKL